MTKSPRFRIFLFLVILCLLGFFIWWSTKPSNMGGNVSRRGGSQNSLVKIIHPQIKSVPITIEEVGSVEAGQTVNIISQVSGILTKITIEQGQDVQQGQQLFEIDPSVYATDVIQAQANMQRDKAQLDLLKSTANRYKNLAKLEYVTLQQYEEALTAVREQEAAVAADAAQLQQKQILLNYTKIRSPISGKAGVINVHVGDLITANSATPLLVVNRLENVLINFSIGQARLQEVLKYQRAGTLTVRVLDESGQEKLAKGELAFISNVVSGQTGTVQVKAKVANSDLILWPGQLVTVRLKLMVEKNVMVIPSNSVQLGQKGNFVYLVKNNKALVQPIIVAREVNGQSVVSQGLQLNDDIIAEIPPGIEDGAPVRIENAPPPPASPMGSKP